MATDNLTALDTGQLAAFVEGGGGIAAVHPCWPAGAWSLLGALGTAPGPTPRRAVYESGGLVFSGDLLPAFTGLHLPQGRLTGHGSLDLMPARHAEIVARTAVGRPLAWRVRHGGGRVLFWNSILLADRHWRGLIVESVAAVAQVSVRPKANVALLHVDDFPAPLGLAAPATRARGRSHPPKRQFYAQTWYRDLLRLTARHRFQVTCFAVFCYTWRGQDIAPEVTSDHRRDCFAAIRHHGGEIGLHGLNHRPLTGSGWDGRAAMRDALREAMAMWQAQGLGPPPKAYAPPANCYDSDGVAALIEAVPSIETICGSAAATDRSLGGGRDYGSEPFAPSLFALPRSTWGHGCAPETLPLAAAQVAEAGVWSHFLHPDDIADMPHPGEPPYTRRNPHGRSWRGPLGLRAGLSGMLDAMRQRFPWLEGIRTDEGAERMKAHLAGTWQTRLEGGRLRIEGPVGVTAEIRFNGSPRPELGSVQGARVLHAVEGDDFLLLVLRLERPTAEVTLRVSEAALAHLG